MASMQSLAQVEVTQSCLAVFVSCLFQQQSYRQQGVQSAADLDNWMTLQHRLACMCCVLVHTCATFLCDTDVFDTDMCAVQHLMC